MSEPTERQLLEHLGPLELQIMQAVWSMGPSTVNDVLDRLNRRKGRDLVYNTVMSTLARLADKGYLERERDGRAYVYNGTGPEDFMRARVAEAVRTAVEDYGDLALSGVKEALNDETRAELVKMLSEDD